MFGLYVDPKKHTFLWQRGRRPGVYRNILNITGAIQEELGPDTCGYGEAELSREIEKLDPEGFGLFQGEGNLQNISLSTRVSDKDIDSLQTCSMVFGKRA